ncbi:hypothetical protein PMAYCL1PPCAC_26548, partial [Pristionchus mayeri]
SFSICIFQFLVKISFFTGIPEAAPIEVTLFHISTLLITDSSPTKVNLTIGAYRTEEGKPWVLPVVHNAEVALADDALLNHEYLPLLGFDAFSKAATALVLGENSPAIAEGRAFGIQSLSGTGSLRLGADYLHSQCKMDTVYVSKPTWGNHKLVFKTAGFKEVRDYTYWDATNRRVDIERLIKDLEGAPERAVVILHGCAHNPTGMDPTQDQWKQICEVVKRKHLFTFFDIAYQGFASGDADAWAIRYFVSQGVEMIIAQSFAKNFGLYNERVGNLTFVVNDKSTIAGIKSQASLCVRANWSNPPAHGARIIHKVLTTPALRQEWLGCIKTMSTRIKEMRAALQ